MNGPRRGFRSRDERGQSAVEFVLVLPFILVLIFLVVEMTGMLHAWMALEGASREGARFAAVGKSASEVTDVTVARSGDLLTPADVAVTNAAGQPGTDVQVAVTYTYTLRTPLGRLVQYVTHNGNGINGPMTMRASTRMRLE